MAVNDENEWNLMKIKYFNNIVWYIIRAKHSKCIVSMNIWLPTSMNIWLPTSVIIWLLHLWIFDSNIYDSLTPYIYEYLTPYICDYLTIWLPTSMNIWLLTSMNIWLLTSINIWLPTSMNIWLPTSMNIWLTSMIIWFSRSMVIAIWLLLTNGDIVWLSQHITTILSVLECILYLMVMLGLKPPIE